ncbi:psbP domain-containing protein 3, chloroplastic isoform X2 [Argentina anserina]|uniref:psbP domain-containing protein 3, chloroplastic isoform X2 n=1 Tax=Argentina anserina TaxID=57926 RepID=UPI0021764E7B|nr:psbP domain-containing protein 3, chloroplastic isoform X2 [Potentilla anserina]
MASVASWHPLFLRPRTTSNITGTAICRKSYLQCCNNKEHDPQPEPEEKLVFGMQCQAKRRQVLLGTTLAAFSIPQFFSNIALAENEDFRVFTDDVNKFQISIPLDWQEGAGEPSGFKSVTAFYPEEGVSSSISVVITGLGPDFTKMESFGKVEEFAETLVSGLDRSWQRTAGVAAKLIDSKSSKGIYYIDYTLQKPGESIKHICSALGMANNGWYNRLYTVTGQYVEEDSDKYRSKIEKAVKSFKFI